MSPSQLDYPAASPAVKPTTAAWIVKRNASEGPLYNPFCRHSNRVESACSAVSVHLVIVLAGNEFRLIKSAKRAVCDTFPNR